MRDERKRNPRPGVPGTRVFLCPATRLLLLYSGELNINYIPQYSVTMKCGISLSFLSWICGPLLVIAPVSAEAAPKVRITKLVNVAFGTISNFSTDLTNSQSICIFNSDGQGGIYHVIATGSGSGGAFTLASGSNTLAYEVQWSASSGQTSGQSLTAGVSLNGLTTDASQQNCNSGPATTASLITILRTAAVSAATAGAYSGTLTLLIAPN